MTDYKNLKLIASSSPHIRSKDNTRSIMLDVIIALLPANNLAGPALFDFAAPSKALNIVKYSAADAIAALADEGSTVELYAGYGKNIVTALATINGSAVGILATEKAALCHKCTAKAARFVRLCDAYSIPVVTVVNTEGFGKSEGDDQAGGIRQAARMAGVYAEATTVKVAVLAGEAVGPAYTVFAACADWRVSVQGCTVAPLAPEAAVTVLYKDEIFASDNIVNATKAKAAAYAKEVCSANAAVANGAADAIADAATARGAVAQALDMLASKRTVRLCQPQRSPAPGIQPNPLVHPRRPGRGGGHPHPGHPPQPVRPGAGPEAGELL